MIIQVIDYYNTGNAVANCAVSFFNYTEKLGYEAALVARLIDKKDSLIKDLSYLDNLDENDILMYHLCIGTVLNRRICQCKCRKILVYHNITPPAFFYSYNPGLAEYCNEGLNDVKGLREYFEYCIADSEFNKSDLVRYGYDEQKITVIPPLIEFNINSVEPNGKILKKYNDGWVNLLFVGRLSPNKKQDDLVRAFAYYKTNYNAKSRLIIAGGADENDKYYQEIKRLIEELNLSDVIITKQIPYDELLAYYKVASLFVCLSEHEGYCIPLIEAMHFNIPIIAYNEAAVKDTLSNGGILLDSKEPENVAETIDGLINDNDAKEKIKENQNEYLKTISEENLLNRFKKWLESVQVHKSKPLIKTEAPSEDKYLKSPIRQHYDVVLILKADDWSKIKQSIPYILENLQPKNLIIVSSKKILEYISGYDNLTFICEDELQQGLSLKQVKSTLSKCGLPTNRAGWYLQQFIKLSYAFICKDDYYLVWDADTIPLNPINMFDDKTGKPVFDMKPEYVAEYFRTLKKLLNYEKIEHESYISEHMLFNTEVVKMMIKEMEKNDNIQGKNYYEKVLNAVDFSNQDNCFSEFETYGTYCEYNFPDLYQKRHLRTFRAGKMFLGSNSTDDVLNWVSDDFDTISFEQPQQCNEMSRKLSLSEKFRDDFSFETLVRLTHAYLRYTENDTLSAVQAALSMDYFWVDENEYINSQDYFKRTDTD